MVNKHPIVFIHEDIIDESSMDSDATVELTTNNSTQTSSPPPSASINNDFPLSASNHQVRTNIIKTRPIQERTRSQHLQNEIMAMIELENGDLSLRALQSPRETLRTYIKERVPIPVPRGQDNFLNSRFDNDATLLHGSVQLLRHDVTEMLLTYGADVNIMDNGKTIAHTAAELNDTLLLLILGRHKADFSVRNDEGETPLMVAIALCNREAIKLIWNFRPLNILSANEETILHYAARHNNVSVARQACHPDLQINIHQQSQHELRTALHIAVQQSNVTITRVLLEHGALDQWEDRYGRKAHEYIKNDAIGMLFFRYNLPCGIEPTDVSSRSTSPINIEENSQELHHNEAPQGSNAQQQSPLRIKTFARLSMTADETTTSPPAKRRNFVPSERGKFTASTVRKGQQRETTIVAEQQAGTSATINSQTTVARPEPTPKPPYTNVMEPQPGPSSHRNVQPTPLLTELLENKTPERYVLYNPQLRDDSTLLKTSFLGFASTSNWKESNPIEPPCPSDYTRPNFALLTSFFNYRMNNITEYRMHLRHLNSQYSRRLQTANRPKYRRELYELYLWERMHINNTLIRVRAALIRAAIAKQLAETYHRAGPSC